MSQREQWIDIGKGIAIILMVVGHTSIPSVLSNFIWAFHMPFFFIVSGWITHWNKTSVKEFIIRRSKSLLIPFVVYSIIVLALYSQLGINKWLDVVRHGWGGYALWFIPVLFVASLIAKLVMSQKVITPIWAIIILIALGAVFRYLHVALPWTLSTVPYATALILIGSYASTRVFFKHNAFLFFVGFIITLVVSNFWRLDMAANQIIPVVPLTVGALSGSMMLLIFSKLIEKYSSFVTKALSAIGRETYVVLTFSQIIILFLNHFTTLGSTLRYAVLIMILVVITFLKNRVNYLIGEKLF